MTGRRRTAGRVFVALITIAALALLAAPAYGYHKGTEKAVDSAISETVPLPLNNWTAYTFNLNLGDAIKYDIRVTTGGPIDVYFVPPDGLQSYANDSALQFRLYLDLVNNRTFAGSFGGATGSVSVLLDNTNFTQGGVDATGAVTVSVGLEKTSTLFLGGVLFILCGVGFLVVALVVLVVLRRRRAPAAPPPPAPYSEPPVQPAKGAPPGGDPTEPPPPPGP